MNMFKLPSGIIINMDNVFMILPTEANVKVSPISGGDGDAATLKGADAEAMRKWAGRVPNLVGAKAEKKAGKKTRPQSDAAITTPERERAFQLAESLPLHSPFQMKLSMGDTRWAVRTETGYADLGGSCPVLRVHDGTLRDTNTGEYVEMITMTHAK